MDNIDFPFPFGNYYPFLDNTGMDSSAQTVN